MKILRKTNRSFCNFIFFYKSPYYSYQYELVKAYQRADKAEKKAEQASNEYMKQDKGYKRKLLLLLLLRKILKLSGAV